MTYGKHREKYSRVIGDQIHELTTQRFWRRLRCINQIWAIYHHPREKIMNKITAKKVTSDLWGHNFRLFSGITIAASTTGWTTTLRSQSQRDESIQRVTYPVRSSSSHIKRASVPLWRSVILSWVKLRVKSSRYAKWTSNRPRPSWRKTRRKIRRTRANLGSQLTFVWTLRPITNPVHYPIFREVKSSKVYELTFF